ncbi:MAG: hypothetical protein SFX72_17815 [Isosphaeraceae bacterium]|nr:hypothetical protein [Isosphaeraceae bacterium]
MSLVVRQRPLFRSHISVKCTCGRSLRAKLDQAGGEIKCWDCRAVVPVPIPREPGWVVRALRRGVREALQAQVFMGILAGACVAAAILMLPGFGLYVAGGVAAIGVAAYGYAARSASRDERSAWTKESWILQAWRVLLCVSVGALMVLPWIFWNGGIGDPPRFTRTGLLIVSAAAVVLPLVILGSFARDIQGRSGFGLVFRTLIRHPFASACALAILPAAFIAAEIVLTLTMRYQEVYPFFLLDLFPKPQGFFYHFSLPYYDAEGGWLEHMALPMSYYSNLHRTRLGQGYTFVMGMIGSVTIGTDNGFNPWGIYLTPRGFARLQFFYTSLISLVMLTALAVQARWLGLLSTLNTRRSVS